jgi:hypothetical protein
VKEWLRWWSPVVVSNQWVVAALAAGLGLLVLVALFRAVLYIREYGFWNYLRSTFSIENETWRLIGILLLLAMACAMVFFQVI